MTTLFDELQIGSMRLKNRTFMAPMSLGRVWRSNGNSYATRTGILA